MVERAKLCRAQRPGLRPLSMEMFIVIEDIGFLLAARTVGNQKAAQRAAALRAAPTSLPGGLWPVLHILLAHCHE